MSLTHNIREAVLLPSSGARPAYMSLQLSSHKSWNTKENKYMTDWFVSTGEINVKDLQKFALEAFPSFVTRITAATMQPFLGPDPTIPCVILFTDKDATPPVFAALSVNLRKYRYKFADAHSSDAALMSQFNIKKVSLKFLHPASSSCTIIRSQEHLHSALTKIVPVTVNSSEYLADADKHQDQNLTFSVIVQVPTMVITHLKPGTEEEAVKEGKLGLQQYPGPLKYSYMHSFLSTFAGMLGCVPLTTYPRCHFCNMVSLLPVQWVAVPSVCKLFLPASAA